MEYSAVIPDSRLTHVVSVESTVEAAQGCNCGNVLRREVIQLEKKVEKLEEVLLDKDALIASLRAKNKQTTAELIEFQLQKVTSSMGLVLGTRMAWLF